MADSRKPAKLLVLYTGGTIGMTRNENNALAPRSDEFVRRIRAYPNMHDPDYPSGNGDVNTLTLPHVDGEPRRIRYTICEFRPLLDSTNMAVKDWIDIAHEIRDKYHRYDAFVVLHGTDTMCYTASALSFLFENLGKTVIVTGSQIPIFEPRTDGLNNFISTLILAGRGDIPEVCVYFNDRLFRGNRITKYSNCSWNAFRSPNAEPLATLGLGIHVNNDSIVHSGNGGPFRVYDRLDVKVDFIYLHPFISTETINDILRAKNGVVLLTYGAGNIPLDREGLRSALMKAARDKLIVNCTQCNEGTVCDLYETGRELEKIGIVSGLDMTLEATLVKLSFVLARDDWDLQEKKRKMKTDLRGELTPPCQN